MIEINFGMEWIPLKKVKGRLNKSLDIAGIIITQYHNRKILNRNVAETLKKHFKKKVFNTRIRNNITLAEAPTQGKDIFTYNENCNGAKDYKAIVKQIMKTK